MRRTTITFDEFFSECPFIPMTEICKHLGVRETMLLSLNNYRFYRAVEAGCIRNEATFSIQVVPRSYQLSVKFANHLSDSFVINYTLAEFYGSSETTSYFLSPVPDKEVDTAYHCHTFNRYSGDKQNLERNFLEMLKLVCKVFQAKPDELSMIMRPEAAEFTDKLLLSLPLEPATSLKLEFDGDNGDKALIKGTTIQRLLEGIECQDELYLKGMMDESFVSDYIHLNVRTSITLEDARFLTGKNLETMQFQVGSFGINNLTSEDFHKFLKAWKYRPRRECRLKMVKFLISDNQKIVPEKVLEGLEAQPYDPRVRDPGILISTDEILDLKSAMDIRKDNRLATVLINDNQIVFIVWGVYTFPLEDKLNSLKFDISKYERTLEKLYKEKKELEGRYAVSRWTTMDHEMLVNENEILKNRMQLREALVTRKIVQEFKK